MAWSDLIGHVAPRQGDPPLESRANSITISIMTEPTITSYLAFWPFYLREHSRADTRTMHVVGTSLALILVALAAVFG